MDSEQNLRLWDQEIGLILESGGGSTGTEDENSHCPGERNPTVQPGPPLLPRFNTPQTPLM